MTPLPGALEPNAPLVAWRIDHSKFASSWHSGIGAERFGGRWNPKGFKAVYCSIDPSTCLVETAVHRGFAVLDSEPHVLTSLSISALEDVRVIRSDEVPNPAWLHGGTPSDGQQSWGAKLLAEHAFLVLPSAASKMSWNLVFEPSKAQGRFQIRSQDRLTLDTRLNPRAARSQ